MLQQTLGLAAWLIVLILPLWALRLIFARPLAWPWLPVAALPLALLASAACLATRPLPDSWPFWVGLGGFVGDFMLNRLERPVGPELYPTVTGGIALVLVVLAVGLSVRELWHGARALALAPFRLGRPPAGSRQDEPRWAQAIEQRYGAPPARRARARPLAAGSALIGGLLGGLAARLRALARAPAARATSSARSIRRSRRPNARRRRPAARQGRARPGAGRRGGQAARRPRARAKAAPRRSRRSWSRRAASSCRRSTSSPPRASAAASASIARAWPRPPARSRRCSTTSACAARSSTSGPARWSRSTSSSRRPAPAPRA